MSHDQLHKLIYFCTFTICRKYLCSFLTDMVPVVDLDLN